MFECKVVIIIIKMFFLITIEKVVRIEPFELGKNLEFKIRRKYKRVLFTLLGSRTPLLEPAQVPTGTSSKCQCK